MSRWSPPASRSPQSPRCSDTLEAFELRDGEWVLIACAKDDEPVSIRPFDAITFSLGELWRYAVALVGDPVGPLVDTAAADEAIDIVHSTVPRAAECARDELVARTEREYRDRYLLGAEMPATWSRL